MNFVKRSVFALFLCTFGLLFSCQPNQQLNTGGITNIVDDVTSAATQANKYEFVVLYTNDTHCTYEPEKDSMGFTNLVALKNKFKAKTPYVTLVDCGDAIQGAAIGTISKGRYIVDLMNKSGYDFKIFGNHEFDYTLPVLSKMIEYSDAIYLNSNITYTGSNINYLKNTKPYSIVDYGSKKVGFIGIATPDSIITSTPKYFMEPNSKGVNEIVYDFKDGEKLYKTIQNYVNLVRAEGADYVIALSHLGIDVPESKNSAYTVIANTYGIDAMLDAHSHSSVPQELKKNKKGEDVVYSQTGDHFSKIGCLRIDAEGKITTDLFSTNEFDYDMDRFVATINDEVAAELNRPVAKSEIELRQDKSTVRSNRAPIGNLTADAFRIIGDADIAFMNGGGIRAPISAGQITNGDLINVFPFGNYLRVVKASGQKILDALEWGSRYITSNASAKGEGCFLHVSGLKYTIDVNKTGDTGDGDHPDATYNSNWEFDSTGKIVLSAKETLDRRVKDVVVWDKEKNEYVAIDPAKEYVLACHNYKLENCGDGFGMFKDCQVVTNNSMLDNMVLITFINDYLNGVIPAGNAVATDPNTFAYSADNFEKRITFQGRDNP